ncbi:MAG: stage III sporulation protein AB [Ruminococcus sp.]|nr:stage III sporulation protein AB [Ruminococcus sp.]
MIKLIFSLVLIISATLIGNTFSIKLTNRRKTLTAIVGAISRIKTLICFGGMDTKRVVEQCMCAEDFPLLSSENLSFDTHFDKAFEESVEKISNSFSLTESDKELLTQFGTQLGSTDVTGQIAHTELYTTLFTERLNYVKEQESTKSKLYRVLGFSLGCAISLLIV